MDELAGWVRALAEAATDHVTSPRRICDLCVEMLNVTGAGISMMTEAGSNRGVVCATDDVAAQIEDLQFTLGEGPCIESVRSGVPVLIPDLDVPDDVAVDRWPAFTKGAGVAGVRAVFAFPLRVGAINVGALDLYRDRPGELSETHLRAGFMAADAAALVLLRTEINSDESLADDVEDISAFQLQVHQATGMVQIQLGVTTAEAFLMLRARAFALGRPIAEVATDVVARRLRFTAEDK